MPPRHLWTKDAKPSRPLAGFFPPIGSFLGWPTTWPQMASKKPKQRLRIASQGPFPPRNSPTHVASLGHGLDPSSPQNLRTANAPHQTSARPIRSAERPNQRAVLPWNRTSETSKSLARRCDAQPTMTNDLPLEPTCHEAPLPLERRQNPPTRPIHPHPTTTPIRRDAGLQMARLLASAWPFAQDVLSRHPKPPSNRSTSLLSKALAATWQEIQPMALRGATTTPAGIHG